MRKALYFLWPVFILVCVLVLSASELAQAEVIKFSGQLAPSDYLLGSQEQHRDPVFDEYRTVDLGLNLGVGSDCGRIDFKSTLRSTLSNVLDTKYFGDMGKDILAASPMLLTCYFSPTWCAILKHSQINANWLSQMRLDQCSIMDKYVDTRVEDYYQERQGCVRKAIEQNGGNLERAMDSCRGESIWKTGLANWAGEKYGEKAETNKLIESSAKWAGYDDARAKPSVDLLKSLVGDTVISRGSVSVEYGPKNTPLTPRTYLQSIDKATYAKLCGSLVRKVVDANGKTSVDQLVSDEELKELSPTGDTPGVDRQTIRSLAYMMPHQRDVACRKLSESLAMASFSADVNRSLDLMNTLAQNPNLPPQRKAELEQKRKALKEQIELTIELKRQRNEPLNAVLSQINEDGKRLRSEAVYQDLASDADFQNNRRRTMTFMDCSDGVMCGSLDKE